MRSVVIGAGGFIGGHLAHRLKHREGHWVRAVDIKQHEFREPHTFCDEFFEADMRLKEKVALAITPDIDEVYQLAADMGGAEFCFTGVNDADIMHNSAMINLHILQRCAEVGIKKIFYSSSACIYPERNQLDPSNPICTEDSAYPAAPDSEYGWEKLFSERVFEAYHRCYGVDVRVARFHNIFGPHGTWMGGREKAPAALCRKIIRAKDGESIDVFGSGKQTRSFLIVDDCVEGILRLMRHPTFRGPVNIGSEEMVSINELVDMIADVAGKAIDKHHIDGPIGVNGRNSDNALIFKELGWKPMTSLRDGIVTTYAWIEEQVKAQLE